MQTSVTRLMELQEDHQLNCPLRGRGVAGEWNTPVVLPPSCCNTTEQPRAQHCCSAAPQVLMGALLWTKIFTTRIFQKNGSQLHGEWRAAVASCRSVKCQKKRHHPSVSSTFPSEPALMEQCAANTTDSTGGLHFGNTGRNH